MGQTMLYDLNLAWSPATPRDLLLQLLAMSASLGYGTVALNHTLTTAPPTDHVSPIPDLSSLTSTAAEGLNQAQGSSPLTPKLPAILHRATITLADPGSSTYRIPALSRTYDLVAVRPVTADAFQNACLTIDAPIISLDMTQHFPFHFRPKPCMAAVARGVRFEICYGQVLGGGGGGKTALTSSSAPPDARSRASFIANVTQLVRATRGRGIIVSSEARAPLGLRPPADVVNLLSVWGLANERGMEALRSGPRGVVVNEGLKRTGYKGVVNVVQLAQGGGSGKNARGDGDDDSNQKTKAAHGEQTAGGKKGKKQKRKNGEGAEPAQQNKKVKLVSRESKKSEG